MILLRMHIDKENIQLVMTVQHIHNYTYIYYNKVSKKSASNFSNMN